MSKFSITYGDIEICRDDEELQHCETIMLVKEHIKRFTGFDTSRQVLSAGGVIIEDHLTINDLSLNLLQFESGVTSKDKKRENDIFKANLNLYIAEGQYNFVVNVVGPSKGTNDI